MTAAVVVAAFVLYTWRLGDAPIHLSPDEAIIATGAHAVATTGHDLQGAWLPLYFFIQLPGDTRSGWFMPAIFYLSAAVLQVVPLAEWSARLATVIVAVTSLGLLYVLARRIFRRDAVALATVALMALAPGHYILARYALDYLFPVPFILGWLLCFRLALERDSARWAAGGGLCLGVGFYSYIASMVMMPLYAALSVVVVLGARRAPRLMAATVAGAAAPLLLFVVWLAQHPAAFADTAQRYELYDAQNLNPLQGLRELLSFPNVDRMASLYWSFYNPSFLFLSGDRQMMFSTRSDGILPMATAALLPLGVAQVLGRDRTPFSLLILAGFVTAPAAALLVPEPAALNRSVALLPFGALLGGFGVQRLWAMSRLPAARAVLWPAGLAAALVGVVYGGYVAVAAERVSRSSVALALGGAALIAMTRLPDRVRQGPALAVLLLAAVGLQFAAFADDYFGDYRLRSSAWLGGNVRGALETLIDLEAQTGAPAVYFAPLQSEGRLGDSRNRWMPAYWRFYTSKRDRGDLLARSHRLSTVPIETVPPGSLVLANIGDPDTETLVAAGTLRDVATIPEPAGEPFFRILAKP